MVIVNELDGFRLAIHVDKDRPDAWRKEPYLSDIRELGEGAALNDQQVLVCIGRRVIAILPGREVDLGLIDPDERIVTGMTADGVWQAFKAHKDDPRIAGMVPGVPFGRSRAR